MSEPGGPASIDPGLSIASVHLTVHDLAAQLAFYRDRLGLEVSIEERGRAVLGAGGRELLVLREDRGARDARGTAGLYHFALLLPSRRDLANALARLASTGVPLTGVADHGVSEALYLNDAEGNGIELYRDRPRPEWPRDHGALRMTSDPLDVGELVASADPDSVTLAPLAAGTVVGHVHLHVSHLEASKQFYCDTLGFDLMQRFGHSALFVSAAGYHHHLGLNTWLGVGAPPPPPGALGLDHFVIRLSSAASGQQVLERLEAAGASVEREEARFTTLDPTTHRVTFEWASG
jgi:catechol 2,3-dioxygenase